MVNQNPELQCFFDKVNKNLMFQARPSNTVYIERDGMLSGLITSGDIARKYDEKTCRVPINKKFSLGDFVFLLESWKGMKSPCEKGQYKKASSVSGQGWRVV